ncbi:DNA-binding HxlR family transcriptional regulator [Kitasatospora sp. GP30]|nr:DNA-binding HxlR family transcriptional regulator [Kitasatospora sp. GP30]
MDEAHKWSVQVMVELSRGVRRLERDGLVACTVHPTVPPQVEYELTGLGWSLARLVRTGAAE